MLCAKHGFAQSMDCAAQSMDPHFAQAIHGLRYVCTIPGLRKLQVACTWAVVHRTAIEGRRKTMLRGTGVAYNNHQRN